jgi:Uma2 family endonuclease
MMLQATPEKPWTPPVQGQWTYTDYQHLPDDGNRYEIIQGVLFVTNAPNLDHQFTVTALAGEFYSFVKGKSIGRVFVAPCEVHLSERSKPVQPDLFFIQQSRLPTRSAPFFAGAPDLIVEVISPSSIRLDRVIKFTEYEQTEVTEYWIVDPLARIIEIYVLSNGEYGLLGTFKDDDVLQSQVLAGIEIVANLLFA